VPAALTTAVALFDLAKPRLAAMSVLSAMAAYATAMPRLGLVHALLTASGTTLAAAGALALNQWWEREADAQMKRTRHRPLPRGQLRPGLALAAALVFAGSGVGLLAGAVNVPAAVCAAATIVVYGLIYTPLKRRSRWATEVGAISGALPALLGNAAAGDVLARPGLALAAVLLVWQMPHFFAIGWRHRGDYRAAGFPLLPAVDPTGARTARWCLGYAVALLPVSLVPWFAGCLGPFYGSVGVLAGAFFLRAAWRFSRAQPTRDEAARRLFFSSLCYLPAMMAALILDTAVGR
jgi:heme o synthase